MGASSSVSQMRRHLTGAMQYNLIYRVLFFIGCQGARSSRLVFCDPLLFYPLYVYYILSAQYGTEVKT